MEHMYTYVLSPPAGSNVEQHAFLGEVFIHVIDPFVQPPQDELHF